MHRPRTRLTPDQRKRQIIVAAVKDSLTHGVFNISLSSVSKLLPDCSKSTVKGYFTQSELRAAVIAYAREYGSHYDTILAHAVSMKHHGTESIPQSIKEQLLQDLVRIVPGAST
jgi:hypothetical protein